MKRLSYILVFTGVLYLLGTVSVSCVGTAPAKEVHLIDSLNQVAYSYRYKNLDSSCHAANLAYRKVKYYNQGKAEACNNLGFCAFMRMDFEKAEMHYHEVYDLTKNELELLIADVGLMKIYQRTALNKEFYDYRNSALRRMKRIAEDTDLFVDKHERMRLTYASSEFNIVSAIYYYYLQQRPEALAAIDEVQANEALATDTNQLLYYHYIKGSASLCKGETLDERRLREFDELYMTWKLASRKGYLYFEGNGVQGLANLMASPDDYEYFLNRRSHALRQFGEPLDSLLPMRLGQLALKNFRRYNDLYQIAGAYVSIGKYLNAHGQYEAALDTLKQALECVNDHHRNFYDCHDSLDWLKAYNRRDTVCAEKSWIRQKLKTVPEWISRIREQLSVTYAGLGMKEYSDYNRNIYLDILEDTRQDRELESRYQALEKEARQLNWLLLLVIVSIIGVIVFLWFFNKRSKVRNKLHLHRLQSILDICQKITASIPGDVQTEEDIINAIEKAVRPDIEELFGTKDACIENRQFVFPQRMNKEELAMMQVITPYIHWALDNGMTSISLNEEQRRLEKRRYIHELHIAGNKRQNLIKKACLSIVYGIHPYIDRILNEVRKLTEREYIHNEVIKREKFQYIDELVTTINEYNDILALWIKMRQGTLSLNIETFELNELFELLRKGVRAFEMKNLTFEVEPTDVRVKADKALTLFMINTLSENARKYTPAGGTVKVFARNHEDYVEISIEDNGCGLSEEDIAHIVKEKVYDSKAIGMNDAENPEELRKNKGSGYGLMNCKGIIEKYRKTNELFKVCLFNVESRLGKGSRFYFRLPAGVRKNLMIAVAFLSIGCISCQKPVNNDKPESIVRDSVALTLYDEYEDLLDEASDYADAAYYSNVDGEYETALQYIDSAMLCLNNHYKKYARSPHRYMTLTGDDTPAELNWWNEVFNTDYHVILDIRNEAAVAFLALKQWNNYTYNNVAYTTLYKLLGEDQSLEEYCKQLERSTTNKMVSILLIAVLFFTLCIGYYILYFRRRLVNRWNLEQVLEINKRVFTATVLPVQKTEESLQREEDILKEIPRQIVDNVFGAVRELLNIDRIGIAVYNENTYELEYAFNSQTGLAEIPMQWKELVQDSFESQVYQTEKQLQALPLAVEVGGSVRCIGVLCMERNEGWQQESDHLLSELIARYVAIVIFNAVIKLATKYRDIETAQDDVSRVSWEDNQLHVQNMVLDNCLSTIKHETIYYPNKIKQLIGKLRTEQLSKAEELEMVSTIGELIEYYKGIFTILSQCASRQLEEVTFRRSVIAVGDLTAAAEKYFRKAVKGSSAAISFRTETLDESVIGDVNQLYFLFESLIDEAVSVPLDGEIHLSCAVENEFVRFFFTDARRSKTQEELNQLFYPNLAGMKTGDRGELHGTEYLICKQIIRDHDEFAGRRGCRINAEQAANGGFTVYFTLPRAITCDTNHDI